MKINHRVARFGILTAIVSVFAVAAACGGSAATATPQAPVQTKSAATTAPAATVHTDHAAEIDQQNLAFMPARVSIKVGQTVLIKNSESTYHTANINGKNITGNMKKGDATPWVARTPGEYNVSCDYHPQMSATIVVS